MRAGSSKLLGRVRIEVASSPIAKPPADVKFEDQTLVAGTTLYRICIDNRGATEFADCDGPTRRFGPWRRASGECVAVLYTASTLDAVIMEVAFHDVELTLPEPKAFLSDLRMRRSTLTLRRDLRLARLDDPALAQLGISRAELIDTPPSKYHETALWAGAVHDDPSGFDGLVWNSQRHPSSLVQVLFADRVDRLADIDVAAEPVPMLSGNGYEELMAVATAHGITVIH